MLITVVYNMTIKMMEKPKKPTIMFYGTSYDYSTQTSKILTCVTMGTNLKR